MTQAFDHTHQRFMKMHGAGNDFVVMDTRGRAPVSAELAKALGDRHRGVGFDQLAEILPGGDAADVELKFWNSDGSTAGACGNATRCVAAHLMTQDGTKHLTLRTERGLLKAEMSGDQVRVNMGHPQFDWQDIPLSHAMEPDGLDIEGAPFAVGMGNPIVCSLLMMLKQWMWRRAVRRSNTTPISRKRPMLSSRLCVQKQRFGCGFGNAARESP